VVKPVTDKTLVPEPEFAESKAIVAERKPPASTLFLLALAALALYFCYLIARPFLNPIFVALMIAIVFHPVYVWLQQRIRRRNLAALTSTILVLAVVVVPTLVLGIRVTKEVRGLYQLLNEKSAAQGGWNPYAMHFVDHLTGWTGKYVDLSTLDLRGALLRLLEQIGRFFVSWGARIAGNIISFFAEAVIAFFTLFFVFRDGESMRARIAALVPLKAGQFDRIFTGVSNSLIANVQGCLAVGAAQGSLLSLGFWVLGLPSPILWGLVTGLCSLIPIIGSAAVWGPAVIMLFISGHTWKALILLGWSAGLVAHIDNFVRPYIISQRAKTHPLLVFFALLGGVSAFGVMGLFIGPLVLSVTLVVLEMLREANLDQSAA
jgi:predicted PurR-regulated permease PerM